MTFKPRHFLPALLFALACSGPAFGKSQEALIRDVLQKQKEEWNRGNIEGYMVGYWENDSLVFIGKDGPTYGYKSTLARYRKAYPDTVAMGKLRFNILSVRLLSSKYAFVTGLWDLTRQDGPKSGAFTLLFRKIGGSWVIVSDHSS